MDISEWTYEYLKRNSKLRGWVIEEKDIENGVFKIRNKNGELTYVVSGDLSVMHSHLEKFKGENIIVVCHNRTHNIGTLKREAHSFAEKAGSASTKLRLMFANTDTDQFWTANITVMHKQGTLDHLVQNINSYVGEVPLM